MFTLSWAVLNFAIAFYRLWELVVDGERVAFYFLLHLFIGVFMVWQYWFFKDPL